MGSPGNKHKVYRQRKKEQARFRTSGNVQKDRLCLWACCLVSSAVLLALVSKCSFLYPFNDWVDANIFFTMGKSMMNGRVLYRDIYDHKGPLLYFLHGLAWLISHEGFLGVYVLEVVAWTAFLAGAYRIVALYVKNPGLWLIPLLCALIVTSQSFCHGDSAEELVLPLLVWGLYSILKYLKESGLEPADYRMVFLHGISAGCILCVKFTLLGLYFAWTVILMTACFWRREWKRGILTGLVMLAGMATACLPWIFYFGWHHALTDWWTGYIYNNLFLYSGAGRLSLFAMAKAVAKMTLDTFANNWQFSILTIVGVLWYGLFDRRESRAGKAGLWFVCVMTTLGICVGVKQWQPYYGLILSIFSCLGMAALVECARQGQGRVRISAKVQLTGAGMLSMALCLLGANYRDSFLATKDSLIQYQFAAQMQAEANTTLLNYGFLDGGFYTVAGIVPDCRYFAKLNLPLEEMLRIQQEYVEEAQAAYIVTREFELEPEYQDDYRLIGQGEQDYEGILYQYFLYERMDGNQ